MVQLVVFLLALARLASAASNLTADISLFGGAEKVKVFDDVDKDFVKIEMEGPSENWIGIGFNGTDMNNTYAIMCGGKETKCQENALSYGAYGIELEGAIKVIKAEMKDGIRFVEMERRRVVENENGKLNESYFVFPSQSDSVSIIACIGTTVDFNVDSHMQNATVSTATFK